ncbi:BTAD domain-containing putative transcriptional regulator [Nocardia sp. NPDC059240]|uniref:BTAD domain-containing putative transcriptional regulator n=1 Tax=Nocardia sp. NPDC059240 TaxID=3346786 RepID=UPI003687232F
MQVRLLGPVTATDGVEIPIGGPRVRALLALLTLEAGRPVPVARLIDRIWDEQLPVDAVNALQTLVKRLRSSLPDRVIRHDSGYSLTLDPEAADVHRFTAALAAGRAFLVAGQAGQAAERLDAALAEWRGAPLADVAESPGLHTLALELTDQRLVAIELRADAYRLLGRSGEVLHELAAEAAAHPFRETLAARLITALNAVGRRSEAIRMFERIEELLHTELGTAPAAVLREAMAEVRFAPSEDGVAQTDAGAVTPIFPAARASSDTIGVGTESTAGQVNSANWPIPATLPRRFTSFVGRGADVDGVARMLGACRVVTLVGTGGVGKTRLATETIEAHADDWPDGRVFVELAVLDRERPDRADPATVGRTILTALGHLDQPDPGDDWLETLCHTLRDRRMLLMLDNCEHVAASTAQATAALLQRLPLLTVLATSREALGIDGERLYPVRTLPLPAADATRAEADSSAAVRLFTDRAAAVRPDFALTEDNCADLCALVRGLDGLPLAIELAAARMQALPLREITARLTDRFRLLTSSARYAVPRHRTLLAAVAWSWELLTEPEAELARRFSIFACGATLDAIIRTCGADPIDVLASLVAKSLIEFDGERYRMAETIRAYAAGQLEISGRSDLMARTFADYAIEFTDAAAVGLLGPAQHDWLRRLSADHGNLEAALRWAIRTGDSARALRLHGNLAWFWMLCGYHEVLTAYRDEVLALVGDRPPDGCAGAYLASRYAAGLPPQVLGIWWMRIDCDAVEFERLVRIAMAEAHPPHPIFVLILALRSKVDGDSRLLAECTAAEDNWLRGNALLLESYEALGGDTPRSGLPMLEAAVECLGRHGDPRSHTRALIACARFHLRFSGLDTAAPIIARAVDLLVDELSVSEQVGVLSQAAGMHLFAGDIDGGAQYLDRAQGLPAERLAPVVRQSLAANQAQLASLRGDPQRAIALFRQLPGPLLPPGPAPLVPHDAIRLIDPVEHLLLYAAALTEAGLLDDAARELAPARALAQPAFPVLLAAIAAGYAVLAVAHGAFEQAARIVGVVERINQRTGIRLVGADLRRAREGARAALTPERFAAECAVGTATGDAQIIDLLDRGPATAAEPLLCGDSRLTV